MNAQIKLESSIQFIPSTMACERVEKERLHEELDQEMREFLKRGGKVQKLKSGQSAYKYNMQPLRQSVFEKAKPTPDHVIEEKNAKIRAGTIKKERKPKIRMSVEMIDAIRLEQMNMLTEFDAKLDILNRKRFCDELGISKKFYLNAKCGDSRIGVKTWNKAKELMKTFIISKVEPKDVDDRLYELAEAKRQAIESGNIYFEATCLKHGKTQYKITTNNIPRCISCISEGVKRRNDAKLTQEQRDNAERKEFNRSEMLKAIENGVRSFSGKCNKHGFCEFKLTKGIKSKSGEIRHQYKCNECKKESRNGSKNNA